MKTTQIFYCIGVIILLTSGVMEEKQNVRDLLINKTWEYIFPIEQKLTATVRYSENKESVQVIFNNINEKNEKISPYYLSETPDEEFDEKKINKSKTGKFIIVNSDRSDGEGYDYKVIEVSEILEITENYLKLRYNNQEFELKKVDD